MKGDNLERERRVGESIVFGANLSGERIHFLLRLCDGHAVAQTANHAQITLIRRTAGQIGAKRHVRIHLRRDARSFGKDNPETWRHDSNNCDGLAIEPHRLSNPSTVRTKTAVPETIADNHHARRARSLFDLLKQSSQLRVRAKNAEKVGRHHPKSHLFGLAFSR